MRLTSKSAPAFDNEIFTPWPPDMHMHEISLIYAINEFF